MMTTHFKVVLPGAAALILLLASAGAAKKSDSPKLNYPKAPTSDTVDNYHGVRVADPYRPLENVDAPATLAWEKAENKLTFSYLATIPQRPAIRTLLKKVWNYERYSVPFKEGGRYFFTKNNGLQNQAPLYVLDSLTGRPRLLLDPNRLSSDGTVALAGYTVSRDGKYLAYGTAASGSDWNTWHVKNVDTGEDLADTLDWVRFSGASWTADNAGFYYCRYDAPPPGKTYKAEAKFQKVYYHRIGTPQSQDSLVYQRTDKPDYAFSPQVTDDGHYLALNIESGSDVGVRLDYRDLKATGSTIHRLFDDAKTKYLFIGNDGPLFFILTDRDAPRYRVVTVDVSRTPDDPQDVTTVIPESGDTIQNVSLIGHRLIVTYMHDASSRVAVFSEAGKYENEIPLPALGSVTGFYGHVNDTETFYEFTSFTYPGEIFHYDIASGKSSVVFEPKLTFRPADFETREVFYPSKDGTKIPLFLVYQKGLKLNGENPTLLYGYGGFDIPLTPHFSPRNLAWVEMGGVYAMACLRGGSEYGEAWHKAGMLGNKQNVFDDFAAAARWLIASRYTNPKRLAINGASNGGLLIGATLNQHPELFGAAIPEVGVMDMLRFQKFTAGVFWISEYGSSDNPEQFQWLIKYSPLQNIKKGVTYPPTMILTADHDDRVFPAHSFKYAATLQQDQGGKAPVLIRIESKAGHGGGKPTSKWIDETADIYAFIWKSIGGLKIPVQP